MATLTMRPYVGESDLEPIVDLINFCEAVDRYEEGFSLEELRVDLEDPDFDKGRDLRLWEDGEGRLIGFGYIYSPRSGEQLDGYLWLKVHPSARGNEVESEIVAWAETRMREIGLEGGRPAKLRPGARSEDRALRSLLEARGYSVARSFWRMKRPLARPIAEPQFPEGITVRPLAGDEEIVEWVACFNESFVDHWNHHPTTVEQRRHTMSFPDYKRERDLVAVAPDGRFAGFCFCSIDSEENARNGANEGWIRTLGTRRGFRKIGLGRALLLAGLHLLKAEGVDTAKLGVDAANPNGATNLYKSAGFEVAFERISYEKDV